jgi:hypothetical protein
MFPVVFMETAVSLGYVQRDGEGGSLKFVQQVIMTIETVVSRQLQDFSVEIESEFVDI